MLFRSPDENLHRVTASGTWSAPICSDGNLAGTALWGRNLVAGESSDSFLAEVNADLDGSNVPFARVEYVQKFGHDLVLPGDPEARTNVFQAQIGYVRRFPQIGPLVLTTGIAIDIGVVPDSIAGVYGTNTPLGAFVFVGLQPPMMTAAHHMTGM